VRISSAWGLDQTIRLNTIIESPPKALADKSSLPFSSAPALPPLPLPPSLPPSLPPTFLDPIRVVEVPALLVSPPAHVQLQLHDRERSGSDGCVREGGREGREAGREGGGRF